MRSGAKDALVNIIRRVKVANPNGYNQPIWEDAIWKQEIFGRLVYKRGNEADIDNQVQATVLARFDFDYFDVEGLQETDIIVHEGVRYDIKAVLSDPALKVNMTVDCTVRPQLTGTMD